VLFQKKQKMENKHLDVIPADILAQVQMHIDAANVAVRPYEITLTPTERRDMLKMGDKSLSFVEKSHEYAVKNPELVPPYLNMPAFNIDFADAHGLWTCRNSALQLYEAIDDTTMAAGSEAYQAALVFYNSVKVAAANDVPGAKAIYSELKQRFPGGKRKSSETEEESIV
jgi:hypothetical protein